MRSFAQPDFGNTQRPGSPVNSIRALQRRLNRQRRAGQIKMVGGKLCVLKREAA